MATLQLSMSSYGEIFTLLKRQGIEINDGQALTIEKGTALVPPVDFRMVALRQNCLDAAARAYVAPVNSKDFNVQDDARFIKFCEAIYQWAFTGKAPDILETTNYLNQPDTKETTKPKKDAGVTKIIPPKTTW